MKQDEIVRLTDRAIIAVKTFMDQPEIDASGLRVGIKGGGCAGYQYTLDFCDPLPTDFKFEQDGLMIIIDPISAMLLEGTEVDYTMGFSGTGFKFINPNAKNTCGCGSSFSE